MNTKIYEVFKTKKKIVKVNNLTASPSEEIFYDFSVMNKMNGIDDTILTKIKMQLMTYHTAGASWLMQPLPFGVSDSVFTNYNCEFKTAYTKIFTKSYKRMMIIITVTSVHIEKWQRETVYNRSYELKNSFDAKNNYSSGEYPDIEIV